MTKSQLDGLEYVISDVFRKDAESITRKWDKEWMRYFSLGKDYSFYFYDMDTENYALQVSSSSIEKFTPDQFMNTTLCRNVKGGVWLYGSDIINKNILEIGCGPGIFGRISSRLAKNYTGIDASKFALYIARLTSPQSCCYYHLYDKQALKNLGKSFDVSFGRHFFIHHNYEDSLWILKFLRDVTKRGGIVLADFFSDVDSIDGDRRVTAASDMNSEHPSALYSFSDKDISKISKQASLICEHIEYVPENQCRYVRFRVPQ